MNQYTSDITLKKKKMHPNVGLELDPEIKSWVINRLNYAGALILKFIFKQMHFDLSLIVHMIPFLRFLSWKPSITSCVHFSLSLILCLSKIISFSLGQNHFCFLHHSAFPFLIPSFTENGHCIPLYTSHIQLFSFIFIGF